MPLIYFEEYSIGGFGERSMKESNNPLASVTCPLFGETEHKGKERAFLQHFFHEHIVRHRQL